MGEFDSTRNVEKYGLHIFNAYKNNNLEPIIEDMTEEYVEEDNKKILLTDYSNCISTIAIPNFFLMKTLKVSAL